MRVCPADAILDLSTVMATDTDDTAALQALVDIYMKRLCNQRIAELKACDVLRRQDTADLFAASERSEHDIPLLPDSQPPFQRMYRLTPSESREVQQEVTDLFVRSWLRAQPVCLEQRD